ncbi:Werner Syndrome-like exonuclease [Telopea speciosissima]|uniref:Werner Syndrome-like exonuclease n=1 Tax=Telopea speciosissima TaxID=54955 RepID=UPI001CC603AA|nr:Werner Syndrome-like exonuclease [Telopea speciosissima]
MALLNVSNSETFSAILSLKSKDSQKQDLERLQFELDHHGWFQFDCEPWLVVGLDVEWHPSFSRSVEYKVAILQLCVERTCLVFQLLYADHIPNSLIDFLKNPNLKFVGVGIEEDVERLLEDHELNVLNNLDLRSLAAKRLSMPKLRSSGLKELTREVLGKEIGKPEKVTMSRWDAEWLTYDQVQYACLDAFLSFEIGKSLLQKRRRTGE